MTALTIAFFVLSGLTAMLALVFIDKVMSDSREYQAFMNDIELRIKKLEEKR